MLGTPAIYQHLRIHVSHTGNNNKHQSGRIDGNQQYQNIFKNSYINHSQQFFLLFNNETMAYNHPDISLENLLINNNKYKFIRNIGVRLSLKNQIKHSKCDGIGYDPNQMHRQQGNIQISKTLTNIIPLIIKENNIMYISETRYKYKYKRLLLHNILNNDEVKLSTDKRSSMSSYCGSKAICFGRLSTMPNISVVRSFAVKSGKRSDQHQTLCFDQSYYDNVDVLQLLDEINNNLQWRMTPKNIYNVIGKKQKNKCNIFMAKHNLELNQCEFIAIKLWSLSEQLTKHYHIDCENNKSFKWKLFINALTNGIRKIHKAVIINTLYDHENKIFPSFPNSLYRGTKVFDPNCKIWRLETILSFTTSLRIAAAFGQSSQYNQQNEICVLNIDNAKQYLLNGQLIAAPIEWLSIYSSENEWIVLPSISTFYVQKDIEKRIIAGNMYKLLLTNNVQ